MLKAKEFIHEWSHFLSRIDFEHTCMDAQAITFMNTMPADVTTALDVHNKLKEIFVIQAHEYAECTEGIEEHET